MEIFVAILIFSAAGYIVYKNLRNKAKGGCNCGSCSSHCPQYKNDRK